VSHYHADHIYGLQVFKDEGAEILAPRGAYEYLESPAAVERLDERRFSLDPWVNDETRLVKPDRLIEDEYHFSLGGVDFQVNYLGSAHSEGDMTLYVAQDRVLYSGDIIFEGRVPFVGDADTRRWLETLERLETGELAALVPGHGPAADDPVGAISRTREYLAYLRKVMGDAVADFQDFASAYEAADWSRFDQLPAFDAANRRNAYQVFLSMEAEALGQ
jgi:glyoxylase-like metal-dependent hydrolase (beta-lactamase superfamily II)